MEDEPIRAALLLRVVARAIDFTLIFAAAEALPKAGWLAGLSYLLICDGLFEGRSVGKMLTGLRVLSRGGAPCSIKDSILRNSTLAVGFFLWRLPFVGWLLMAACVGLEFLVLLGSKDGKRLGDEIAGTAVLEMKVAKEA